MIHVVMPNSPAEKAELFEGDVITSINDEPIRNFEHLTEALKHYHPGDSVQIKMRRHEIPMERTAILQRRGSP